MTALQLAAVPTDSLVAELRRRGVALELEMSSHTDLVNDPLSLGAYVPKVPGPDGLVVTFSLDGDPVITWRRSRFEVHQAAFVRLSRCVAIVEES